MFMMPNIRAYSEPWMYRMLEGVMDQTVLLACGETKGEKRVNGNIPVIRTYQFDRYRNLLPKWRWVQNWLFRFDGIVRDIESYGVTHILCHYGAWAWEYMPVWNRVSAKLFVHFHGYDAFVDLNHPDGQPFHPPEYVDRLKELQARAVFIANSEFTKRALVQHGLDAARIEVKYLGVPVPDRQVVHSSKESVQIAAVGRLVDFKAPSKTIRAFDLACREGLRGTLKIAGDGPLRAECEAERERSEFKDRIELLGAVPSSRVDELLLETDIFTQHNERGVTTNQEEAYGVSVLEAMALGIPVVGTRSGGVLETVEDGVTGILGAPGDIEAQAKAIRRLAGDHELRDAMGSAGRARVASHFTNRHEADRLKQILAG